MLQTLDLAKRFASRTLFENVSIKLDAGKRYGLIGANGAGKSTFLKIISGQDEASSGEIVVGSGLKIGVLGQNQFAFESFTVSDAVLYGNRRLFDAVKEKERLYMEGNFEDERVNERLGELEMVCVEEDPMYEYDVRIERILSDLDFDKTEQNALMKEITTADKFKVLLAQVLFPKPDILFLDEPTNNLDIHAIAWLENQLTRHEGTLMVISHDRHFLNAVCTHILDLDFKNIREFTGNYDDWYIASNLLQKQRELARSKKLKEKEQLESFIRRFSANASKAKQATSRQKQLDKLDLSALVQSSRREPSIVFKANREMGKEALNIEGLSKSFDGNAVIRNLDLRITPGEKIGLIGPNGVGKTTFCRLIMEELTPDAGTVAWGATVESDYFPQDTTDRIQGSETLYDWLRSFDKEAEIPEIRNALGRMLFSGEEQEKSIENLSGGEKHRMMLSKIMLKGGNFLVFDEPTNHLDLEAIIAFGEALYTFPGNVICVTHDRELLDAFTTRIIEFKPDGSVVDFLGNFEAYVQSNEGGA